MLTSSLASFDDEKHIGKNRNSINWRFQVFFVQKLELKTAILEIFLEILVVALDSVLDTLDLRTKILYWLKFDDKHDATNRNDLRPISGLGLGYAKFKKSVFCT